MSFVACGGGGGAGGGTALTIGLTASADTPAQVTLTWTAPADQTQFDLYRDGTAVHATHIGGRSFTEFTLQPGTRYCYMLNAVQFPVGVVGTSNTACVATPPLAAWPTDVIDRDAPQAVALALEGANAAQIAMRTAGGVVLLTRDDAGAWRRRVVAGSAGATGAIAIAADAARAVHLAWHDGSRGVLMYATDAAGVWTTAEIDAGGAQVAIAIAAGRLHLVYSGAPGLGAPLMHAVNAGGGWNREFVAAGAVQRLSVSIDGAGGLHIGLARGDGVSCELSHASDASGAWSESHVVSGVRCAAALAVGRDGSLHAIYLASGPPFALVHASNAGGAWSPAPVDTFYWIPGDRLSIEVDAADRVHLGYVDHSGLLKYASGAGAGWTRAWIGTGAREAALQVGGDGRARIAYVGASGTSTELRWTVQP